METEICNRGAMDFLSRCKENVPLSTLSTFHIGGPTRLFFEAKNIEDVQEALRWALATSTKTIVIGKGSNTLFADEGFDGLVIQNSIVHCIESSGVFSVGGGYSFSLLGVRSARAGWGGLEFAAGIPGSIGGAIYMNAGANGQCIADVVCSVDCVNERGERRSIPREEIDFGYRFSSFQSLGGVIVSVDVQLHSLPEALIRQKEMLERRKHTQPYCERSAGCSFRNPLDLSAGRLIDEVGLKGMKIGGAQVSTLHANFIINTGDAKASDVVKLLSYIRETVHKKTGVLLEPEVRIIGAKGE